jgi:hypothetical protein
LFDLVELLAIALATTMTLKVHQFVRADIGMPELPMLAIN